MSSEAAVLPQLIDLAGGSQKVVTLADFDGSKEHGVRFSNGFADRLTLTRGGR
jgi:hypothetical protein